MKKEYIQPQIRVEILDPNAILITAGSGSTDGQLSKQASFEVESDDDEENEWY